jgi:hypothetical protein
MNPTSKFDTLKSWLEEDLTDVVDSKDHWSRVSQRKEDKILSTSSTNCAGCLPEPQLPGSLILLRDFLSAPAKPVKYLKFFCIYMGIIRLHLYFLSV